MAETAENIEPDAPAEPTMTVELTALQRSVVLNGLHDQLLEVNRYLSGSKVAKEPGPMDTCCPEHLARYERDKDTYALLKARKKGVVSCLELFQTTVV